MKITLAYGGGGKETAALIERYIKKYLGNEILDRLEDAAILALTPPLAFSTDSFVVSPLFFPGGDIGKLAVCGTANDLAVMGANPRVLSMALIIEEGFDTDDLEKILQSIGSECETGGLKVVCGDIKVIEKGKGDGLFINTAGIGQRRPGTALSIRNVKAGDAVILSGPVGEHGAAILNAQKGLGLFSGIRSDCAQLAPLIARVLEAGHEIHAIRDVTRGGVAAVANEMGAAAGTTVVINEKRVSVPNPVRALCDLLGLSPLELANEGKIMLAAPKGQAPEICARMREHPLGRDARIVGHVEKAGPFPAVVETLLGVRNILEMPRGEHLPRIC